MNLQDYFLKREGIGILSTADEQGKVNAAVYAKPHVLDGKSIAFIMGDKLTHSNIEHNPYACYLFIEKTSGYEGVRLYLRKNSEEKNTELIEELRRRSSPAKKEKDLYLVKFTVEKVLPLIGSAVANIILEG